MARSRFAKPEFFDDPVLARCSHPARLLFIATWQIADRLGIFEWDAAKLRKYAFGYEDITAGQVLVMLDELVLGGFIRWADVDGRRYGLVVTLAKHQKFHVAEKSRFDDVKSSAKWCGTPCWQGADPVQAPPETASGTGPTRCQNPFPLRPSLETESGEPQPGAGTDARALDELSPMGTNHPLVAFFEADYRKRFGGGPLSKLERSRAAEVVRRCIESKVEWADVLAFYADERWAFTGHTVEWLRDHLREMLNKLAKAGGITSDDPEPDVLGADGGAAWNAWNERRKAKRGKS